MTDPLQNPALVSCPQHIHIVKILGLIYLCLIHTSLRGLNHHIRVRKSVVGDTIIHASKILLRVLVLNGLHHDFVSVHNALPNQIYKFFKLLHAFALLIEL